MIRLIVAMDSKGGLADEHGIPWTLRSDRQHYQEKTKHGLILRGYGTYIDNDRPSHGKLTYVATTKGEKLRATFKKVADARSFLNQAEEDVWVIGGAGLISSTLDLIDELYITQLEGDFRCTKFMPPYRDIFKLVDQSPGHKENGVSFRYQVWRRID